MKIGSLFSGIGGLELGLEWAGLGSTIWQCEKDPFCREVLKKHWPDAIVFDDVCTIGAANLPTVDILCGGFPCQDLSFAGKRAGIRGKRSGLWIEFVRIIREIRPQYVVMENVSALLAGGLSGILGALATIGYDAWWDCIPASAIGAPHQRDRIFIVAHSSRDGWLFSEPEKTVSAKHSRRTTSQRDISATLARMDQGVPRKRSKSVTSAVSPMGQSIDGFSRWLDRGWPARPKEDQKEWEAPRTMNCPDPDQKKRLCALGNAVVPGVGYIIGKAILTLHAPPGAPR
jgi:DNA (cytosine-5)-methyltransferase 1